MIVSAIEDKSVTHERLRLLGILSKQCALVMENTLLFGHLQEEHEALRKAQAQIIQAEKFAGIGRLTSGAFHELLNPLNVISGHLQIMMLADELPPSVGANLPVMKSAADRIAAIVNSLLQFSAKRPKTVQPIAVGGLLHGVLDEQTTARPGRPIAVTFSIGKPLPPVWVAAEDLKTVVRHLVDNACEAMPHGGRLTIGAHLAAGAAETEPQLEISVADNGTGIAEGDTHKVFDPFFTTKDIGQGTGLSLAVSYALVRSMGGTLSFERLAPQGTVFRIRLPLTRPRQASP
jgi:signal transduction histidine kinase